MRAVAATSDWCLVARMLRALQMAPASAVSLIDKRSLPGTIILAAILLRESVDWQGAFGVMLMTAGGLHHLVLDSSDVIAHVRSARDSMREAAYAQESGDDEPEGKPGYCQ